MTVTAEGSLPEGALELVSGSRLALTQKSISRDTAGLPAPGALEGNCSGGPWSSQVSHRNVCTHSLSCRKSSKYFVNLSICCFLKP